MLFDRLGGHALDTPGRPQVAAISYIQTVARLKNPASTRTGQTAAIGLMPADFKATISFEPVIRPKTLLTA